MPPGTPNDIGQLAGARVLVTGARGFIGSHLCARLHKLGAEVYGTSRVSHANAAPYVRWFTTGLDEAQQVKELLAIKPGVIFHLAGPTSAARSLSMVLPTFQGTLSTTVNVLTAAAEAGTPRIVIAGSLEARPDDALTVSSPYSAAKRACEMYTRMFSQLYGTPVTSARIFMTYGPGQSDTRKLVPYVILSLLRGQTPKLSSADRLVDWVYIDDVVEGLVRTAVAPGLSGESVDIGTGRTLTVRSIVARLVKLTESRAAPEFGALPDRPLEVVAKADVADTKAKIDWLPQVSVEEGLRSTVAAYRAALADAEKLQR